MLESMAPFIFVPWTLNFFFDMENFITQLRIMKMEHIANGQKYNQEFSLGILKVVR